MTLHTYAILDVPGSVYAAVRTLLAAADYGHALHAESDGGHGNTCEPKRTALAYTQRGGA